MFLLKVVFTFDELLNCYLREALFTYLSASSYKQPVFPGM